MTPAQAFICIDQVLASQKLALTPPEFAQFLKAMETLHESIVKKPENDNLTNHAS